MAIVTSTQTSVPAYFSTNADFQGWYGAIGAACDACGWTKTSDTGQISGSASKPGGSDTVVGYEIRKNAAGTCYVKLEYGSANTNAAHPGLRAAVGYGSNGSGSLTGNKSGSSASFVVYSTWPSSGNTLTIKASGDGNGLWLASDVRPTEPTDGSFLAIEHPIDGAGVPQTDAIIGINGSVPGTALSCQVVPQAGTVPSVNYVSSTFFTSQAAGDTVDGLDIGLWPATILVNSDVLASRLLMYRKADLDSALSTIDVSLLGGTAKYLLLGGHSYAGASPYNVNKFAFPWAA